MPPTKVSGRDEVAKLASRIYRQVGKPDGLDAEALARGYLALERERDALREALEAALPWIGVREDNRGHWCPPEVREAARAALEHPE